MNEFVKIITHARRFKSAVKEVSIYQLEEIRKKLDGIIEDRKKELAEEEKKNAKKLEKIAKYKKMLAADGLAPDDLQNTDIIASKKRGAKPPKYEVYVDGKRVTWSGQGRMPNVFKSKVDAGENLEDYLID